MIATQNCNIILKRDKDNDFRMSKIPRNPLSFVSLNNSIKLIDGTRFCSFSK